MRLHDGKGKRRKVDRNINVFLLTDWLILASQFTQSAIGFNGTPIKTHRFVIINFTREGQAGNKTRYKPFLPSGAALPAWRIGCTSQRKIKGYSDNAKQFKNAEKVSPRRIDRANNEAKTTDRENSKQQIIKEFFHNKHLTLGTPYRKFCGLSNRKQNAGRHKAEQKSSDPERFRVAVLRFRVSRLAVCPAGQV